MSQSSGDLKNVFIAAGIAFSIPVLKHMGINIAEIPLPVRMLVAGSILLWGIEMWKEYIRGQEPLPNLCNNTIGEQNKSIRQEAKERERRRYNRQSLTLP
ncbi:MAG: hypothetical protein FWF24_01750 [Alphaproteobacteria bacterium]|nr:hypothetical protein [Alphaproteobacteria bacterium]